MFHNGQGAGWWTSIAKFCCTNYSLLLMYITVSIGANGIRSICYDINSHVNKSKGTHQLVGDGILVHALPLHFLGDWRPQRRLHVNAHRMRWGKKKINARNSHIIQKHLVLKTKVYSHPWPLDLFCCLRNYPTLPLKFLTKTNTLSRLLKEVVLDKVLVKYWEYKSWITFKLFSLKI
jgi:hypothetical protein